MKKTARFLALLLAVTLLGGCAGTDDLPPEQPEETERLEQSLPQPTELSYAAGTVLRMATGFGSVQTGLSFDAQTARGGVMLADRITYHVGDLKPTWAEVEKRLDIVIKDKYRGNGGGEELACWAERMDEIDLISGSADSLTEAGEAGELVDLSRYLELMPHLKALLEENPVVRLSVTGNTDIGAFYYAPYFDGVNDLERAPLMRVDWVEKLLDGEGTFYASESGTIGETYYQPYMPTSGKLLIDVVKLNGTGIEVIAKDYDAAGNIIRQMNAAGQMSGVFAVNMLRTYIDKAYGGYYGTKRSDLFVGQNAAWDADELVALLRCVAANAQTLNGSVPIQGIFARADGDESCRADLFRLAGLLFGVRGLDSRQDYLYCDITGKLHDARQEADTYQALERMHDIAREGLISEALLGAAETPDDAVGFLQYGDSWGRGVCGGTEQYMAVLPPVANWQDGSLGSKYMRFTESWRSVKTMGWGISRAGVLNDPDKLCAALRLIDYAYSDEGVILMSYGPDAFLKTNGDGSHATFSYLGSEMPELAEDARAELWEKAGGDCADYARRYLGSELGFLVSGAFAYQCMTETGKEGARHVANALALGTIKHPELRFARTSQNQWYTCMPTTFLLTKREMDLLSLHPELEQSFSLGEGGDNLFIDVIANGCGIAGTNAAVRMANQARRDMGGSDYLKIKQDAANRLLACYGWG